MNMRFGDITGSNRVVDEAIRTIDFSLCARIAAEINRCKDEISAISGVPEGDLTVSRKHLISIWVRYTNNLNAILGGYLDTLIKIGSANPEYGGSDPAQWGYALIHRLVVDVLDNSEGELIPGYLVLLRDEEETVASLLTDFYVEMTGALQQVSTNAKIHLACQGWKEPLSAPDGLPQSTPVDRTDELSLADLEDAPKDLSRCDVVCRIHKILKPVIKEARAWCDSQSHGRNVTSNQLTERYRILRDARNDEIDLILQAKPSPHQCSIQIMTERTGLKAETIGRYLRPMVNSKASALQADPPE